MAEQKRQSFVLYDGSEIEAVTVEDHEQQVREVEEADADLRSLRGELATLLGPRKPRPGVTANEQWIAAVADVLAGREAAERLLAEAVEEFERRAEAAFDLRAGDDPDTDAHARHNAKYQAYNHGAELLKDKLSTLTQQPGGDANDSERAPAISGTIPVTEGRVDDGSPLEDLVVEDAAYIREAIEGGNSPEAEAIRLLREFMCCKAGQDWVVVGLIKPFAHTLFPAETDRGQG